MVQHISISALQVLTQGGHVLTWLKIGRVHGGGKTPHLKITGALWKLINERRSGKTHTD